MATLAKEWISLTQAQAWLDTYDHRWRSDEIIAEMAREMQAGTRHRWQRALIIDASRDVCIDGQSILQGLVSRGRGGQRLVARATDCVFAETSGTITKAGDALLLHTRLEDSVETHRLRMTQLPDGRVVLDPRPWNER